MNPDNEPLVELVLTCKINFTIIDTHSGLRMRTRRFKPHFYRLLTPNVGPHKPRRRSRDKSELHATLRAPQDLQPCLEIVAAARTAHTSGVHAILGSNRLARCHCVYPKSKSASFSRIPAR